MGDIGTERREVEFEPLPQERPARPERTSPPSPRPASPAVPQRVDAPQRGRT